MKNVKHQAAWRITIRALLVSLLALLACALPGQLTAADLGGNFTRLIGDLSGVAYNLQGSLQIGRRVAGDDVALKHPLAVNSGGADETSSSPFLVTRLPDEPANSVLAGRQLELLRMQRDEDGQQDTAKPAPKPEQQPKPMPRRELRSSSSQIAIRAAACEFLSINSGRSLDASIPSKYNM